MNLLNIYHQLLNKYGRQGWWPTISKNEKEKQFEIIVGSILTQNTSWTNVEKAILSLKQSNLLNPEKILKIEKKKLARLIKSSGYYNQKAERLKIISEFFLKSKKTNKIPNREELLKVKGIGQETADSILLYAYNKPYFVVDAYTKRLLSCFNIKFKDYEQYQNFFHKNLPSDAGLFKEFHALIVEHSKKICKKEPDCRNCCLS